MSRPGPVPRNHLLAAYLSGQVPGQLPSEEVSGMTHPGYFESTGMLAPPVSNPSPVALQLALIADEMDIWLRTPRFVQLTCVALSTVHSLGFSYLQTGVRGVLWCFHHCLSKLRVKTLLRRRPGLGRWVVPHQVCEQVLPLTLLVLLGMVLHLLLPK
ncbi:bcl-2-interacting killer [Echinops telfairi]|uniref:Bcl-2-interacting killer n=1 Tax=Echinops telfairi TaxID=9371 RepID=A0AC55DC87_ECHTE|nr:bcl-2-interacting killer [Echinops telfairi]